MLPTAAAFCVWFEAVHRRHAGPQHVVDHVLGDAPNTLAVDAEGRARPLAEAVAEWAGAGVRATLALPRPGDPVGLAGPAGFNQAALDAGEAVVVSGGTGLVPYLDARVLVWSEHPAEPATVPDVREAGQQLRTVLLETTRRLVDLDVASWQPEIPDLLMNLRHGAGARTPRHWDPRRLETLERAQLCLEVVDLALDGHGGAVSAHEMAERRAALRDLDRAARRALVAACSDSLEP
jgi:hypothetical protein